MTAADLPFPTYGRAHARRLREVWRSAGWPCQDTLEIELLAAGLLERVRDGLGHETLRVTDSGVRLLAASLQGNRARMGAHEDLVESVARAEARAGRIVWRALSLRAQVPGQAEGDAAQWCMCRPDVFSIRHTTVPAYVEPVVHEIKVRRADLLADLRLAAKRAAYLDLGACWYVLGQDGRGRCIGDPSEIPDGCGVLVQDGSRLQVARPAAPARREALPFGVWMALARAAPWSAPDDDAQGLLAVAPP